MFQKALKMFLSGAKRMKQFSGVEVRINGLIHFAHNDEKFLGKPFELPPNRHDNYSALGKPVIIQNYNHFR